jgi:colanic acid/amylovoran biosynthesis protein
MRVLIKHPIAAAYLEADVIADFSGDSYRDRPGGVSIAHNVNLLAARSVKKPVVLVSQSLGPFRWYSRHLTRFALNKAALIYIRERRTLAILKDLKVKSRITIAPDIAFVLQRYNKEKLLDIYNQEGISKSDRNKKLVGISTSNLLHYLAQKKYNYDYILAMVHFIEYVHTSNDATVILIPHEIKPACMGIDDRIISYQLAERLQNPSWLKVIKFDHDPSEIKTLISSLDVLIAARMHAGIAALSSNIPTIFLSWSHKYHGLLEEMNIPEFVWDGDTENLDSLKKLFDKLMQERESIKLVLAGYNSVAEESIQSQLNEILRIAKLKRTLQQQAA